MQFLENIMYAMEESPVLEAISFILSLILIPFAAIALIHLVLFLLSTKIGIIILSVLVVMVVIRLVYAGFTSK